MGISEQEQEGRAWLFWVQGAQRAKDPRGTPVTLHCTSSSSKERDPESGVGDPLGHLEGTGWAAFHSPLFPTLFPHMYDRDSGSFLLLSH